MVQGISHPKMAFLLKRFTQKKHIDTKSLSQSKLSRCLSIFDLTSLGIGSTLGAGIYVLTGEVARSIAGPSIVISFFIAAVASVLSGLCYAEFGARVPKAGSAYIYSYVTVGELCAFIIGWNLFLEYVIGASSVARAWSDYFDSILDGRIRNFTLEHFGEIHADGLSTYPDFFAVLLLMFVTLVLGIGVKNSSRFNIIFTGINLFVILFIICVGIYFAKGENWTRDFAPFGISGVFSGAATCFYAFVGFDVIATTGEEARNPSRAIPISIVLALGKERRSVEFVNLLICFTNTMNNSVPTASRFNLWAQLRQFYKANILTSLRSKRFRAVSEKRTRNVSQRPREKWRKNGASKRAGRGWGRKVR